MTLPRLRLAAALAMAAGLGGAAGPDGWMGSALSFALLAIAVTAFGLRRWSGPVEPVAAAVALAAAAAAPLLLIQGEGPFGTEAPGLWLFVAGGTLAVWDRLQGLASATQSRAARFVAPALFGAALLWLWQVLVTGFAVPQVLLPAPDQVARALVMKFDLLWPDFEQTFFRAVLPGYAMGCGLGLLVALVVDRFPFLKRGLLPLCGLASAVPIVGIAPIMVMWFGFDWQSKAAVVVIVTFFPMLVNALAGLASADAMQLDLMHSYAATHSQTLARLRLPTALPFVFNALKINSTLALISAIVAEFFGSPILGLGFRISAEVARLNVDVVWAAIAIAALAGSAFYGVIAAVERMLTFWHPSYRD